MIPKIIHYCWLSNDSIPKDLQSYMSTWHKHMPDYEFVKWDFSRFDINSSDWVKEAFENKKYAFAADYIRLYALYTMGGIYLDMDVEVLKPFDNLLNRRDFLGYESGSNTPEVAAFGVEKGCAWLKLCLDYYKNRHFVKENGAFDDRTLPRIISNLLLENGYTFYECKDIIESVPAKDAIAIFPSDYFSPKSYRTGRIKKTSNTYSIHHFAGSWLPWEQQLEAKFWFMLGYKEHRLLSRRIDKWLNKYIHLKR